MRSSTIDIPAGSLKRRRQVYGSYLVFQLYSHPYLYEDTGEHVIKSTKYDRKIKKDDEEAKTNSAGPSSEPSGQQGVGTTPDSPRQEEKEEEEEEIPSMNVTVTIGLLVVVTVVSIPYLPLWSSMTEAICSS